MSTRREMGETNEWSSLRKEQRPKFYTIIHNTIIHYGSFELPAEFVKKIEKDIVDDGVAILKVPNGNEWRIKMTREFDVDNGARVWLRNGIREFIDYYSISLGHFLVFRYDGNSQFHVVIFDMTATEIGYNIYGDISSGNYHSHDGYEEDLSEHSNGIDDPDNRKSLDYVEISSGSPTDTNESGEDGNGNEAPEKPSSSSRKNRSKSSKSSNANEYVARADAIERGFTSKYPFFRVILQTSYVKSRYMPIPYAIRRSYFPDDVKDVEVKFSDGRSWKIRAVPSGTHDMRFCKGVTKLINKKNGLNLKVGDVLIFEILQEGCLKVNVFRY